MCSMWSFYTATIPLKTIILYSIFYHLGETPSPVIRAARDEGQLCIEGGLCIHGERATGSSGQGQGDHEEESTGAGTARGWEELRGDYGRCERGRGEGRKKS